MSKPISPLPLAKQPLPEQFLRRQSTSQLTKLIEDNSSAGSSIASSSYRRASLADNPTGFGVPLSKTASRSSVGEVSQRRASTQDAASERTPLLGGAFIVSKASTLLDRGPPGSASAHGRPTNGSSARQPHPPERLRSQTSVDSLSRPESQIDFFTSAPPVFLDQLFEPEGGGLYSSVGSLHVLGTDAPAFVGSASWRQSNQMRPYDSDTTVSSDESLGGGSSDDEHEMYETSSDETLSAAGSEGEGPQRGAEWFYRRNERKAGLTRSTPGTMKDLSLKDTPDSPLDNERTYMDFSHLDALFVDPEAYLQSSALSFEGSTLPPVWKKDETALADDVFVPEYVFYSPATGVVRAKRFQDFAGDDGTWLRRQAEVGTFWIDVLNPTAEELFLISKVFSIHPLTIDDIANDDMQREKCDAYPDYLALTIRVIDTHNFDTSEELSPALLWILIYPHCILTFHMQPLSHVSKTIQRLAKLHNLTEKKLKLQVGTEFQTAWIGYLLIDEILSDLNPIIHHIKRESDELDEQLLDVWEDQVENFRDRNMLIRIHEARKQNVVILRLMVDKINVLKGVIKKGSRGVGRGKLLGNELELYFDSLLDRAQAVAQQLKTFEEALTRIHSEYLEEISLCLNAASKTAGDLTRKMTAVVTLLIPVGAITGMMGINVTVPGHHRDDGDGDTTAFWFATVFMLSLIVSGYHFARKWHWFSDPT